MRCLQRLFLAQDRCDNFAVTFVHVGRKATHAGVTGMWGDTPGCISKSADSIVQDMTRSWEAVSAFHGLIQLACLKP
eukprot:365228-Chlamydomonas_euryale.AAC.29